MHQGSCTTSRSGLIAQIDLLLRQLSLLYTGTFSKLLNRAANFSAFDNKLQGWQIAGNHATPWTILESLWKPMNHMTDGQSEETRWEIWSNRRRREKTCAEGRPAQHPIDLPPRVSLEPGVKSTRPRPAGHSDQFTIPANSHGCCWGQWQHLRTTSPPMPATHCCRLGQRSRKWPRPSCWCRSAATPLPQTGGSNSSGKQWQAAVWASANHERTFELALQLHQEPQEPSGRKVSPYLLGRNPPPIATFPPIYLDTLKAHSKPTPSPKMYPKLPPPSPPHLLNQIHLIHPISHRTGTAIIFKRDTSRNQ